MQRADPWVGGADLVDKLSRPVRGAIVDHQDIGLGRHAQDIIDQAGDILALVIGWDYNQCPHATLLAPHSGPCLLARAPSHKRAPTDWRSEPSFSGNYAHYTAWVAEY